MGTLRRSVLGEYTDALKVHIQMCAQKDHCSSQLQFPLSFQSKNNSGFSTQNM